MSPEPTLRLPYAAGLDGLRAIAVLAVLGYHLEVGWMRGGFLGVDLFFVISGYLITRLLLGEHGQTGRLSLGNFWIRRFRRLVPPLVVVVAASVAATRWWGMPAQWQAMRGDSIAALGYVANWRFVMNDTSYFESLLGPSPLRHIWSLAVEEQWYLFWPVVMAAAVPWAARHRRFGVTAGLLVLAAALSALWMSVLYDPADLSRVYYGTDTRAQQLLVGAALAWWTVAAPTHLSAERLRAWRMPLNAVVIGFLVAVALVDDESAWLYHGGLLALSFGAAVLVVATSVPGRHGPLGWLGAPPLVAVGRRSYSLYLWHWPVIVFVGPPMGLDLARPALIALQIVVSFALTELTYRFVESPVRSSTRPPVRVVTGWTVAAALTVVGATTTLTAATSSASALPDIEVLRPTFIPPLAAAAPQAPPTSTANSTANSTVTSDERRSAPIDQATAGVGGASQAAAAPAPTENRLLLLGDSTALVLAVGRPDDVPSAWTTTGYARLGCSITDGETVDAGDTEPTDRRGATDCAEWADEWSELSALFRPTVSVVMIGAWEILDHFHDGGRSSFPDAEWTAHVERAVRRAVDMATAGGGEVVLLTLPCMAQKSNSLVNAQARNDPQRVAAFNAILADVAATLPNVSTLPLDELLCPGGTPLAEVDGEAVRFDGVHLTGAGTDLVWAWLDEQLDAYTVPVN